MSLCDQVVEAKSISAAELLLRAYFCELPFDTPLPLCVEELLRHHPRWSEKSGGGVESVLKVRASGSFALCLRLCRGGNESIDWKRAVKALRNGGKELVGDKRVSIRMAFREAVREQVQTAKAELGGARGDGNDVDHVLAFKTLLGDFLKAETIDIDNVGIEKPAGFGQCWRLADKELECRWQAFHEQHASYQLLPHAAHVEITRQRCLES